VKLARRKLASEIAKRLDSGEAMPHVARAVAALLIDTNKTSELNSLLRDVQEIRARQNGIVEVTASSAHLLTDEQRSDIEKATRRQYPNAKKIIIHHQQNPDIVGGVSLSFANASLDLTIRAKLNRLRALTT
jgi:F0F1-type ATP synthase delta subunit